MNDERNIADVVVDSVDFHSSGWKTILSNESQAGYWAMSSAFSVGARQALEKKEATHSKVLWLLSDACSLVLSPQSRNEPFKPFSVMNGRRSAIPDDFSESEIGLFAQVVDAVDDPRLKARLADLVWLRKKPPDHQFALSAVDAYRLVPIDKDTWVLDGQECWERAIGLARMLGKGAGDRIAEIESAILAAFKLATAQDGFLCLRLADLLETNTLGRTHGAMIAQKLERIAGEYDTAGYLDRSCEYFSTASKWFKIAGDEKKAISVTVAEAEGWIKEAVARLSSERPSHLAAASFYENAIQTYRTIPQAERSAHRVDEKLAELHSKLRQSGAAAVSEMSAVSSSNLDISKITEQARQAVSGRTATAALQSFCSLTPGMNAKRAHARALEQLRNSPVALIVPTRFMSRDGRVVAKRPGLGPGGTPSTQEVASVMIQEHGTFANVVVHSLIWPALHVLWLDHRLREIDFIRLAEQSPIVPKDRSRLFGKALFAGYDGDFVTAIHLLVPQIEHMVRFHLNQSGIKTTTLDTSGIENEIGLSALMETPEAEKILGEDLSFEMRALFCDAFGPNLRNELAHGLLDDDACQSVYSVYAWWLGLKLVFNTFWNATRKGASDSAKGQKG